MIGARWKWAETVFENLNKPAITTALGPEPSSSCNQWVWTNFKNKIIHSPLIGARWKWAKTVFENLNKPAIATALGPEPSSSCNQKVWINIMATLDPGWQMMDSFGLWWTCVNEIRNLSSFLPGGLNGGVKSKLTPLYLGAVGIS